MPDDSFDRDGEEVGGARNFLYPWKKKREVFHNADVEVEE